ncbi:MAG: hypothetical protein HRU15_17330 [Planctomycetes bacterium]|nr:hypothetical protein [Planctomycetota bacterium]
MNNVSRPHQMWPSCFIQPDGVIKKSLKQNANAIMVNTVDTSLDLYDASGPYRQDCINGKLYSGKQVTDKRSTDLKSF